MHARGEAARLPGRPGVATVAAVTLCLAVVRESLDEGFLTFHPGSATTRDRPACGLDGSMPEPDWSGLESRSRVVEISQGGPRLMAQQVGDIGGHRPLCQAGGTEDTLHGRVGLGQERVGSPSRGRVCGVTTEPGHQAPPWGSDSPGRRVGTTTTLDDRAQAEGRVDPWRLGLVTALRPEVP